MVRKKRKTDGIKKAKYINGLFKSKKKSTHTSQKERLFCLNDVFLQCAASATECLDFSNVIHQDKKYFNVTPPLLDCSFSLSPSLSSLSHALSFSPSFFLFFFPCVSVNASWACIAAEIYGGEQCDKLVMHAHNKLILLCSVTESRCCMQWCMWMSSMTTVH